MFEYIAITSPESDPQGLARDLTSKSSDGWELLTIVETQSGFTAFLKRPLKTSQDNPVTVSSANVPKVPAAWYADPSGRYELRYWDGNEWTEHVARGGQQFVDPPVA